MHLFLIAVTNRTQNTANIGAYVRKTATEVTTIYPDIKPVDSNIKDKLSAWVRDGGLVKGGLITISFDDTLESAYTIAKPLLDSYGYKAVEAVVINSVGKESFLNVEQLNEMQSSGWDIVSHSMTHTYVLNTYMISEDEVLGFTTMVTTHGFSKANSCYILPGGSEKEITSLELAVVDDYYYLTRGCINFQSGLLSKDWYYPVQYSYSLVSFWEEKGRY